MKTKTVVQVILWLFSQGLFSQNVGINIDTPQAMLHVAGTVRIDSLPYGNFGTRLLGADSIGNLVSFAQDSFVESVETMPLVYGESIQAGDLVAMGDGVTGYLSAEQQTSPFTSFSVSMGDYIAQSFITSSNAIGIKAVRFRSGSSNPTTFTARIRACSNGVPTGSDIGSASFYHPATNAAVQYIIVFDPPVFVVPNTQYVFIVDFQKPGGGTLPFFYSNADLYPNGMRLYSSNSGATWTSFPSQDMVFSIYETQTQVGHIYKAKTFSSADIMDGAVTHGYSTSLADYSGLADRLDNIVGVAQESGAAGQTKSIFVVQPCNGFLNLIPGRTYYLDGIPGQVSRSSPSGLIERKIGFSLDEHHMIFAH